jgi:chitinase
MSVEKRKYITAAYISDSRMNEFRTEDAFKVTHINYAFALVRDGEVTGSHLKNLNKLNELRNLNPSLQTILSVGGWGAGGFSEAASTAEGRTKFANTAIAFMKSNHFDGIDIDWEYPGSSLAGIASSSEDKYNFTLMLKELREKLDVQGKADHRHYLLTIAVGASQKFVDRTEMDIAHQYLDYVNLMTYDMRGGFQKKASHHTNLYAPTGDPDGISGEKAMNIFAKAGVPIEKMILGAAFYARVWTGVDNIGTGLNQNAEVPGEKTRDYTHLLEDYIGKNGFVRHWDDNAKAPYLFDGNTFFSYDDEESLTYKAEFVKEKELAGIMFWEYPLDNSHTLVDTLYRALK